MDWRARGVGLRVGGHRGASAIAPENTYAAFEEAAAQGAVYTETDIRQTADGELVLVHDPTLDRTSDGRGPVSSMALAEVRALDAGRWFGKEFEGQSIPELPAFLSWIEARPGFGAALEVKAPGIGRAVAQLAWASPARDRLAMYAFDPAEIRAAKAAVPGLPCVLLLYLDADPGGVMATIDACGADGADVPWQWNATSLLGEMRERGLLIGGGSARGGEAAERLIALGTDMIDTDAPAAMLAVVRELTVSASGQ
jgi:glycerophosphoryl diester phosphodiesterase